MFTCYTNTDRIEKKKKKYWKNQIWAKMNVFCGVVEWKEDHSVKKGG